ncbi:hypothetical protein EDB87DRAFT_1609397, partial [Lactarius vividus]
MYSHVPLFCCRYRAHLSKEEVVEHVAPHPDTLELVCSWLAHRGVQSSSILMTHGGDWSTITEAPVSQASELLGASYQLYLRIGTNDTTILRTINYALPVALHTRAQTVVLTTYLASAGAPRQTPQKRSVGGTADMVPRPAVTPADLRWLYAYIPATTDQNMIGIVGFGGDYSSTADRRRSCLNVASPRPKLHGLLDCFLY